MKKLLSRSFVALTLCGLLLVTCQKNQEFSEETLVDQSLSIAEARSYYEQQLKTTEETHPSASSRIAGVRPNRYTYWDFAKEVQINAKQKVVSIPLRYEAWADLGLFGYSRLLMYLDSKGKMKTCIMDVMAPKEYIEKNNYTIKNDNFTGLILFKTWDDDPIDGFNYVNGKEVGHAYIDDQTKTKPNGRVASCVTRCFEIGIQVYNCSYNTTGGAPSGGSGMVAAGGYPATGFISYANANKDVILAAMLPGCSYNVVYGNCATTCTPDLPPVPTYPTSSYNNYGSGGGTTSTSFFDLKNEINNPCIKGVVNVIVNNPATKGRILMLMQKTYGTNNGAINLFFREDYSLGTTYGQVEIATPSIVRLNPSMLYNTTQEFIASVVLHEVIHAMIFSYNDWSKPSAIDNQHEQILKDWVVDLKTSLQILFPSLSDTDALSLALGGLDDVIYSRFGVGTLKEYYKTFVKNTYGIEISTAEAIRNEYKNTTKGTKCL
ncbi:MAG: hypothetical protein U0Y10_04115 [Spirosomataceae bacterium]